MIAAQTGHTIYDAQVLVAAGKADCTLMWSKDTQTGHSVEAFGVSVLSSAEN